MGPDCKRRRGAQARWGRERRCPPSWGSLPRLLRSSRVRDCGASLSAFPSCPSSPLASRSGLSSPTTFGDPRFPAQMGTLKFRGAPFGSPPTVPTFPTFYPARTLEPRPNLAPRPSSWASCGRTRAAALCRHLFPSPWPPRRRAAAWPAEGPVGPEMWHRQGRERPTGRGALQVYPVLKENKIFSWETFPLCFSSPHLFLLLFLSPGLSSRVSFVFPSLEPPP